MYVHRGIIIILLVVFLSVNSYPLIGSNQDLQQVWTKWIEEEVVYIITAQERDVFLSLTSDKEKEGFKRAFWLQRDPTPGTPANEFKDEHYRRLRYASEHFGRGTIKLGGETDRGKIYIILGEPADIQRFYETSANMVPTELWQYYGDTSLGLPPAFYIVFIQDRNLGDYRLYSPSLDGPQRLFQTASSTGDRFQAYLRIKDISGELAEASLSLIPGRGGDPASQGSELSSDILISNIQELPSKKMKSEWADAFVRHKDIVTTDYSVNYIGNNSILFVHQENGKNYLHYVIEPFRLSVNQFEDTIYAPLKINSKISDHSGKMIYQEEKNIQVEMDPKDFKAVERGILAIGDVTPIVEGVYSIDLLLRNSNSKEFSSIENAVSSPPPDTFAVSPVLLLYDEKTVPLNPETIAFLFSGHQLYPNTRGIYTNSDKLMIYFEIYNPSSKYADCVVSIDINDGELNRAHQEEPVGAQTYFLKKFILQSYKPGYYTVLISVTDIAGNRISQQKSEFSISQIAAIPRPWRYSKVYPPLNHAYYSLIRAYQYLGLQEYDLVIKEIENLYNKADPHKEMAKLLAKAYFNMKDYQKVVDILAPLSEVHDFEISELMGKSYFALGQYEFAIDYFKKTLLEGGEITEIINFLGYCYLKINDAKQALEQYERSLSLSPDQPEITKIVQQLKKKI